MKLQIEKGKWNLEFCLFILILIIVNLFYFNPRFIPVGDTTGSFCLSYFFYNEYVAHHHLAQWMPHSSYGVPSLLPQVVVITPIRYLVGFIASLFMIKDVLLIWKISVLLEQMAFLLGLYWLSRLLYSRRSTIAFVCIGGIMSAFWWEQILFNFHLYYMIPLILYFLIAFLKQGRPEFFWGAGLVGISALIGVAPYLIGLWLLIFSILMGLLSFWYWKSWKEIFRFRLSNISLAVLLLFIAVIYVYSVCAQSYGVNIIAKGRDPQTGNVLLENFLNHGGVSSPQALMRAFITGNVRHKILVLGNLSYIGLFPLIFFIWAVIKVRTPVYYALVIITVVLTTLSFGGHVARVLYHFPLMNYYRHLGAISDLIKLFILLCAGFGWEQFFIFFNGLKPKLNIVLFSVFFSGLVFGKALVYPVWAVSLICLYAIGMTGWMFLSRIKKKVSRTTIITFIFLVVFILDMGFYQFLLYRKSTHISSQDRHYLESVKVHPGEYQQQRTFDVPKGSRAELALGLLNSPEKITRTYTTWNNSFLQWEACIPHFTMKMSTPEMGQISEMNPFLPAIAGGCHEPKLRLFSNCQYITAEEEKDMYYKMQGLLNKMVEKDAGRVNKAVRLVQQLMKDNIYIRKVADVTLPTLTMERLPSEQIGTIDIRQYNTDEIIADVDVKRPGGAWLSYAEAFHPDWHAVVDGEKANFFLANGIFKALFLKSGKHHVRLYFDQGPIALARNALAIIGICFGIVYCFFIMKTCLNIKIKN